MSAENPYAGQGMVVLDIGGDIGALVVATPAALAGAEIEICPTSARHQVPDEGSGWWVGPWRSHTHSQRDEHHHRQPSWPHVAVLARRMPHGAQHAAVYPGLRAGRYDLWVRPDGPTVLTVTVAGGQVTNTVWPDADRPNHRQTSHPD